MIFIPHHLHQADTLLREISSWDAETHASLHQPIGEAVQDLLICITSIKNILAKLNAKRNATKAIEFLKELKVDYTLLLYMQLPDHIKRNYGLICYLESICRQLNVDLNVDYNATHFYDSVWAHFETTGISPVDPGKYIIAIKKDTIIEEYAKIKKSWGMHSPFFFQTYTTKDGKFTENVYHITKTVQDGILRLFDILKAGQFVANGRAYKACGAFEHIVDPVNTLTCQLYDCEIMSTAFGGAKTTSEIRSVVEGFPRVLCSLLIAKDLIDISTIVTIVAKDRTREVEEGRVKVSYHFIPNLCAPKSMQRMVANLCFEDSTGRINEACASIKATGLLPECLHDDPLVALDLSAIKSNGITTAFSRKKESDPFPRFAYAEEVCAGCTETIHECLKNPQDFCSGNLDDRQRHFLLYNQLYTAPKKEMLCYEEQGLETMYHSLEASGKVHFYFLFYFIFLLTLINSKNCSHCSHWDSNPYTPEKVLKN